MSVAGNLFENICDYENILIAYNKARRSRRYKLEALIFSELLEENIINIQNHLLWRSYVSGETAYPFIDRVVETAVINVITPIFKPEDITTDNNALKLTIRRKQDSFLQQFNKANYKGRAIGMGEVLTKFGVTAFLSIVVIHFENAVILIWLLIFFEVFDYITGILAAALQNGLSSGTATRGFIKKVCYFFAVGVAFGLDIFVSQASGQLGVELPIKPFGIIALCYLISTESISILENLAELGIEIPILSKFIKSIREKIADDK